MAERQILSLDEFYRKALAAKQKTGPGAPAPGTFIIRTPVTAAAQPGAGNDRRMSFVVATGDTNRNHWQLNPQGWDFADYLNNPVILWAHDDTKLPVAKAEKVWVDGDLLKVAVLFTPAGFSTFNDAVFEMYQQKFLNAVSAGWIPIEYEFVEDDQGWRIMCTKQELVEISCVPVPAEPNALRMAARAGIDIGPLRAWARALVGEPRYVLHAAEPLMREKAEMVRHQFAEFYPGAKLLIVEGAQLTALDDLAAIQQMTVEEFQARAEIVEAGGVVTAGVVPSNVSTDLAPKDAAWSAPTLSDFTNETWDKLDAAEKRRIAGHFAWSAEMPPADFGSLKLPHHEPHGGKAVWKGCTAALSRCMQANTDIPHADIQRVYNHLAKHYRDFGETPPEFHYPAASLEQEPAPAGTSAPETTDIVAKLRVNVEIVGPAASTIPAAGAPASTGEPGAESAALARYTRRIKLLEL